MLDIRELKNEIASYWSGRVEKFCRLRRDELNSDKRELWLAELKRFLPQRRPLDVLDIGTGTGFFCFLLEAAGCRATGIDISPKMIAGARETARELGAVSMRSSRGTSPVFCPICREPIRRGTDCCARAEC